MNARAWVTVLTLAVSPITVWAQGFAGLGASAEGYALPDADTRFVFPDDHGSHDRFRIEWWYLTANLTTESGTELGAQFTLFRNALAPDPEPRDHAWMAHAAVSSPEGHFHAERLARGGIGQAGVTLQPFEAWIDEWRLLGPDLSDVRVFAQGFDFLYDLAFQANGPIIAHGQSGYSVKSPTGHASHYYSQPYYHVSGSVRLPSGTFEVAGSGWIDREWSSQPLSATQKGWDWMSLHLNNGEKLMIYGLRDEAAERYVVGTFVGADQSPVPLEQDDVRLVPLRTSRIANRDMPTSWSVSVPSLSIEITVNALFPDSWMPTAVPYWEGPVQVDGSHTGKGYLELTGYE